MAEFVKASLAAMLNTFDLESVAAIINSLFGTITLLSNVSLCGQLENVAADLRKHPDTTLLADELLVSDFSACGKFVEEVLEQLTDGLHNIRKELVLFERKIPEWKCVFLLQPFG